MSTPSVLPSSPRLHVVTGKGGVGKSTVSAALAWRWARAGLKTLVCEVNAQERVSQLLGHPPAGSDITLLEPNLWAVDIRPDPATREYALMMLRSETLYSLVFENRLTRSLLRFIPSLSELVLLGKVLFHVKEKEGAGWRFDRVVLDAPATGHALTFLSVPQVLLDTLPPSHMVDEATWMRDLLVDPAVTQAVLVATPEELPVNEALELHQALTERVKVAVGTVVLNGFVPPRFTDEERPRDERLAPLLAEHRLLARRSAFERTRLEALGRPVLTLPRFLVGQLGRAETRQVGELLQAGGL